MRSSNRSATAGATLAVRATSFNRSRSSSRHPSRSASSRATTAPPLPYSRAIVIALTIRSAPPTRMLTPEQLQEQLRRAIKFLALAMHDAHWPDQFRRVQPHRRQPPLRDLRLHGARRQDADARSQRHRFLDHLDIVEMHDEVHFDSLRAKEPVQLPPNFEVLVEPDEVQPLQVGRIDLGARRHAG